MVCFKTKSGRGNTNYCLSIGNLRINKMQKLNLPEYKVKFKKEDDKILVFDIFRKKYVRLTPEEWIRQQFAHYMVEELNYPPSLIATEFTIKLNNLTKRSDIVAFNRNGRAIVIVECKASTVNLNQEVFDQIANYNMKLDVKYLIVTNGLKHYCCILDKENSTYVFLEKIPDYASACM